MEREFGEKSYHPSPFYLETIFSGQFNREYTKLFNRKLPGNILVSAYYTPMTVRELAIELGVAAVYLEDEIALLSQYGFLRALPQGRYQTDLVIFTEEFTREFHRTAEAEYTAFLAEILHSMRQRLPAVRRLCFAGAEQDDTHLLWAFLYDVMREGHARFAAAHPLCERKAELYRGATGTNYGIDYVETPSEYSCDAFAGYAGIDAGHYAVFADFGVLPAENHYSRTRDTAGAPVLRETQKKQMEEIFTEEIAQLAVLYERLTSCAARILRMHAPQGVESAVDAVAAQTVFFRTVGLIGAMAVHAGALPCPADATVRACFVCRKETAGREPCVKENGV